MTAVNLAGSSETCVYAEDTDIVLLLLYHFNLSGRDLFMLPTPKKNAKSVRQWDIRFVKTQLLMRMTMNEMLYGNIQSGTDISSACFGIGKKTLFKMCHTNVVVKQAAKVFSDPTSSRTAIEDAGRNTLLQMYSCKSVTSLNTLRYHKFVEKTSKGRVGVEPHVLPPTEAAAKYHSWRAYYQFQIWKSIDCPLKPDDWGWKLVDNQYIPITTDLAPAPQEILKVIFCNCTSGCERGSCTCKKHDLKCSLACGSCKGSACKNKMELDFSTEELNDFEEE
jgi:hypothetical protein